ncbi:MAG: hypothetical protein ACHRXM_21905 [Isosphaerales bacterium]
MTTEHRTVVYHTFQGGRFEDHGVVLDVLEDLVRYRDLLVSVAKVLWRRRNAGRERLPKNFEDSLSMKFYEVQPNCATIPLARVLPPVDERPFFPIEDELDEAIDLVTRTVEAAGQDKPIPEEFPKELLELFDGYGKTLRDDEWIEQRPAGSEKPVRYDAQVHHRLAQAMTAAYEDSVDLIAEVTMARVSRPRMGILLADGREIEASFRAEDERTITTALQDHQTTKVRLVGRGQFGPDGRLHRIHEVTQATLLPGGAIPFDPNAKPFWEEFEEIMAEVPMAEIEKLPRDGSAQLDHYLYGSPKK